MTASPFPDPAPDPSTGLDSTAQLMTLFTAQLHSQLRAIRPVPARPARARPLPARPLPAPPPARPVADPRPALVCVAHGSRDPAARRTATALLARVRRLRPGLRVLLGHVELNEPLLPDALDALPPGTETVVVPLLFGSGYHVKYDIPGAVAGRPGATVAAPLGPHPLLAEALADRLAEALSGTVAETPPATVPDSASFAVPSTARIRAHCDAVVLAAAGSRDPEAVAGTEATAHELSARLHGLSVVPAYASAVRPTVAEAVAGLRARGTERIAVASCFASPGRFAAQCAAAAPGPAATPLGAHPALARLVLHRYDEARGTAAQSGERRPTLRA